MLSTLRLNNITGYSLCSEKFAEVFHCLTGKVFPGISLLRNSTMQINVIEYFEKGTLLKCKEKVAVKDQNGEYTFAQIERFAKNCAALLLKRSDLIKQPVPVFLPKSAQAIITNTGILYTGNCYANLDI